MPIKNIRSFSLNKINRNDEIVNWAYQELEARMLYKDIDATPMQPLGKYPIYKTKLYRDTSTAYVAFSESKVAGILCLGSNQHSVTVSSVSDKYKGQGIGMRLYQAALIDRKVLRSSTSLSVGSTAAWAYLCKMYKGCIVTGKLRVPIAGYKLINGYTIPLVKNLSGDKIPLMLSTDKDFSYREKTQ